MTLALLLTMLLTALALPPASAFAEEAASGEADELVDRKAQAEHYFKAGLSLQKVEDFDAAIHQYRASLRLLPTRAALFNLANCQRAAHHYADALSSLERLKSDYAEDISGPMAEAVAQQIDELGRLTGSLYLQVKSGSSEVAGARISIDGVLTAHSPMSVTRLDVGEHQLTVEREGFRAQELTLVIRPAQVTKLNVMLETQAVKEEATPPPSRGRPPPEDAVADRAQSLRTPGWLTVGAGTALLAGGAGVGLWALAVDADLAQACERGVCPQERASDVDKLETLTLTTNVLLVAGAVTTAAGVLMLALDSGETEDQDAAASTLELTATPSFLGASWRESF